MSYKNPFFVKPNVPLQNISASNNIYRDREPFPFVVRNPFLVHPCGRHRILLPNSSILCIIGTRAEWSTVKSTNTPKYHLPFDSER